MLPENNFAKKKKKRNLGKNDVFKIILRGKQQSGNEINQRQCFGKADDKKHKYSVKTRS